MSRRLPSVLCTSLHSPAVMLTPGVAAPQILSADFCRRHAQHCLNIHHSSLPSFEGARPYHRAHGELAATAGRILTSQMLLWRWRRLLLSLQCIGPAFLVIDSRR